MPLAVPGRQRPFEAQQPAHEIASQTQALLTQCRPAAHGAPVPQEQAPLDEQAFAVTGSHTTQVAPPAPQAAMDGVVQTPFAQQPVGQLWALHTQAPPTHRAPDGHGPGALPQRQVPANGSQRSVLVLSQAEQVPPPTPQAVNEGERQAPFAQQPDGHDFGLHVHAPDTQVVPAPQAGPAPQAHSPVIAQLSATDGSHARQAAPDDPQVVGDRSEQVDPEQQPPAHVAGLQPLQMPPEQVPPPQF